MNLKTILSAFINVLDQLSDEDRKKLLKELIKYGEKNEEN